MMMFETLHAPESQSNPQDIQQTKALMDVLGIYLLVIFWFQYDWMKRNVSKIVFWIHDLETLLT